MYLKVQLADGSLFYVLYIWSEIAYVIPIKSAAV